MLEYNSFSEEKWMLRLMNLEGNQDTNMNDSYKCRFSVPEKLDWATKAKAIKRLPQIHFQKAYNELDDNKSLENTTFAKVQRREMFEDPNTP